jgi:energy-coupling factor transporter ATP-binding protein EcfA2
MYIREIVIQNLRSIESFEMKFDSDHCAGWHVVIGDNGAGKSTLVRAIALALTGPFEAPALRQNWDSWLRKGSNSGGIRLYVDYEPGIDRITGRGRQILTLVPAGLRLKRLVDDQPNSVVLKPEEFDGFDPSRYLWGTGPGWFSSSYGPFRRFAGGDQTYDKLFFSHPRLARHLSAFGEDIALTEALNWLHALHVKKLEKHPDGLILEDLKRLINEGGLLPHGAKFESMSSEGIVFKDGNGNEIPVGELSDGYRSILSMTFELIRQMVGAYGAEQVFRSIRQGQMKIDVPGVVIVDEIDAHLHPTWQRRIGAWFCQYFPKVQFIVTTHSWMVCQSADKGTVWRLPRPGGDTHASGRIKGHELQQLIFGDATDAYGTELFGTDITRSNASKEKLLRLAQLNQKSRRGSTLSPPEAKELDVLRALLPTASSSINGTQS